jgi:hypothetical protein
VDHNAKLITSFALNLAKNISNFPNNPLPLSMGEGQGGGGQKEFSPDRSPLPFIPSRGGEGRFLRDVSRNARDKSSELIM